MCRIFVYAKNAAKVLPFARSWFFGNDYRLLDLVSLLEKKGLHRELFTLLKEMHGRFPSRDQTAAAYAYALLTSPLEDLRNANAAFEISNVAYESSNAVEHGIILVMALIDTGKCADARELAEKLVERSKSEKRTDLTAKLEFEIRRIWESKNCGEN